MGVMDALTQANRQREIALMSHLTGAPAVPREVASRGLLWPVGRDQFGNRVPAWPQFALDAADAVTLPRDVYQGTREASIPEAANLATMLTLGAGAVPAASNELRMGVRAYHGSPHDFDKFELSPRTIGTGEGFQAYGHGLYFAEKEGVATSYRDVLGRDASYRAVDVAGEKRKLPQWLANSIDAGRNIDDMIANFSGRVNETRAKLSDPNANQPWLLEDNLKGLEEIVDTLEKIKAGKGSVAIPGRMYEVDINANPEDFLDWDKPLKGQKAWDKIKEDWDKNLGDPDIIMDRLGIDENTATGQHYINTIVPQRHGEAYAGTSQRMKEQGVPGIRYLDGGSRRAGEGTHNYVVFDADLIEILRKYGWAGLGPFAGAAALSGMPDGGS